VKWHLVSRAGGETNLELNDYMSKLDPATGAADFERSALCTSAARASAYPYPLFMNSICLTSSRRMTFRTELYVLSLFYDEMADLPSVLGGAVLPP